MFGEGYSSRCKSVRTSQNSFFFITLLHEVWQFTNSSSTWIKDGRESLENGNTIDQLSHILDKIRIIVLRCLLDKVVLGYKNLTSPHTRKLKIRFINWNNLQTWFFEVSERTNKIATFLRCWIVLRFDHKWKVNIDRLNEEILEVESLFGVFHGLLIPAQLTWRRLFLRYFT